MSALPFFAASFMEGGVACFAVAWTSVRAGLPGAEANRKTTCAICGLKSALPHAVPPDFDIRISDFLSTGDRRAWGVSLAMTVLAWRHAALLFEEFGEMVPVAKIEPLGDLLDAEA